MMHSILDPTSCGYAKVVCFNLFNNKDILIKNVDENQHIFKSRLLKRRLDLFNSKFAATNQSVDQKYFKDNFHNIVEHVKSIGKRNPTKKKEIFEIFSEEKWNSLGDEKKKHSIFECNACLTNPIYKNGLAMFPVKSFIWKQKAKKHGIVESTVLTDKTNTIIKHLDSLYMKEHKTTFTKQVKKCLHFPNTKDIVRTDKVNIENQYEETCVVRAYGVNVSLRNRQKLRLYQGFEPHSIAKENNNAKKNHDIPKPHKHTGNLANFNWEKENCINEIKRLNQFGEKIVFTQLAKNYKLINEKGNLPENGGQILKQLLLELDDNEVKDIIENVPKKEIIRRKKRRLVLGEKTIDISMPIEPTTKKMKSLLKEQIIADTYEIGDLIVPLTFDQISIKDNEIIQKQIEVKGRKVPLKSLRTKFFELNKNFMRLHSDEELTSMSEENLNYLLKFHKDSTFNHSLEKSEIISKIKHNERTRYLMFWHDGSSISNHGHILMMISCLYDQASYLTDDEYEKKYGKQINVQAIVETPQVYILARCPSTDQQLSYIDERLEDIKELKDPIDFNGILIHDVMRVFKGDNPASQFEAGHQKNEDYFCWQCPLHAQLTSNIVYSMNLPQLNLSDRIEKICKSTTSKNNIIKQKLKLYKDLKKEELVQELHERGIKFTCQSTMKVLQEKIIQEMHGLQRLPALIYKDHNLKLEDLRLDKYEILNNEPLHDVSKHTQNLFEELPRHVEKEFKELFTSIIKMSYNNKEQKKSADHRQSLVTVSFWALKTYPNHFITKILLTLVEMQEILYATENKRSITSIFRFRNISFIHAMLLKIHIQGNVQSMTSRRFFGSYYHSLCFHAPLQNRLFSGRACNIENEEATFNKIKNATNLTSNHHPDNVLLNAMIRLQARNIINGDTTPSQRSENKIKSSYLSIKSSFKNTTIPYEWVKKYKFQIQCLLKSQADYLIDTAQWWKENGKGVEFFDCTNNISTSSLTVSHFRSQTMKEISLHLDACWIKAVNNGNIPAYAINISKDNNQRHLKKLSTLEYFSRSTLDDDTTEDISVNNPEDDPEFNLTNQDTINSFPPIDFSAIKLITPNNSHLGSSNSNDELCIGNTSQSTTQINNASFPPISLDKKHIPSYCTSTPLSHKKAEIIISLKLVEPEQLPQRKTIKQDYSKSSLKLVNLFGEHEFIIKFDDARKKVKKNSEKININEYKKKLAVVEVKVKNLKSDLKKEIKQLEKDCIDENLELNTSKHERRYNEIILYLKHIKMLENELQF